MSLSSGRMPTIDNILHVTGGNIQKIYELVNVPEFLKVAAAMTARRYHDAVQASANSNPPTIAAQAFGNPPGVPVGSASAPQMGAGGLGATPQAGGDMMAAPQPAEAMAEEPMAMAEGGLMSLPVDDSMFDEPDNGGFDDGYAGGGIIAFRTGRQVPEEYGTFFDEQIKQLFPGAIITSGKRSDAENARVGGVKNSYHRLNAARDVKPPPGVSLETFHAALKKQLGPQYDVLNRGTHVHLEPGKALGVPTSQGKELAAAAEEPGNTLYGMPVDFNDIMGMVEERMPGKSEAREAERAEIEKELSPEERKKAKKEAIWSSVAQFGARLASTPGGFLQAAAASAGETLPELRQSIKDLKDETKDLRKQKVALEELDRKDKTDALRMGIDLTQVQGKLAESIADRQAQIAMKQAEMSFERDLAEMKIGADKIIAGMQMAVQQYGVDNSDLKRMIAIKANAGKAAWAAANPKKKMTDGDKALIYDQALSDVLGERYKPQGSGLGGLNLGGVQGGQRPSLSSFEQ